MLSLLKEGVEKEFGRKVLYAKDCSALSGCIRDKVNEVVSPATLRRFFGLMATNSNPSRYTLNVLAKYVGLHDWESFCQKNSAHELACGGTSKLWDIVIQNSAHCSRGTISKVRARSGISLDLAVDRGFIDERMGSFLNSECGATAIVAPGGYGKTTLLAKWYLAQVQKNHNPKDAIFFIPAQIFEQYASSEVFIESWFLRFIGLKSDSNFLNDNFILPSPKGENRLIVVIDALDEIALNGTKRTKIFTAIVELVERFTGNGRLKFVVSARSQCWKQFVQIVPDCGRWYFVQKENFSSEMANIPPLFADEIQRVLDAVVNARYKKRLLVYDLPRDIVDIIGYPYFLQLFVQLYTPENVLLLSNQVNILVEFLKKQVSFSKNADEKDDILNLVIERSNYGEKLLLKNDIKRVYPIHLKLSGNYYSAYEDLVSYGILQEEVSVDSIGGYTKYVNVPNQLLLSVLVARYIIKEFGGINSKLWAWAEHRLNGNELQSLVLENIFKYACKDRLVDALKNFFTIDVALLKQIVERNGIVATLRTDKVLQNQLIPIYLKQPVARRLLVEENIDINHIVTSYSFVLSIYLENAETKDERFFGKTFLTLLGFLTLNGKIACDNIDKTKMPLTGIKPELAAAWFSNMIFYEYFYGQGAIVPLIDSAFAYFIKLCSVDDRIDFIEVFCFALMGLKQNKYLLQFTDPYHFTGQKLSPNRNAVIYIHRNYALYKNNIEISPETVQTTPMLYTYLQNQRSFLTIIMGEAMRSWYYTENNNLDKAYASYRNATELTSASGIKLIESILVDQLADYMDQMLELEKASELRAYSAELWIGSGFKRC